MCNKEATKRVRRKDRGDRMAGGEGQRRQAEARKVTITRTRQCLSYGRRGYPPERLNEKKKT